LPTEIVSEWKPLGWPRAERISHADNERQARPGRSQQNAFNTFAGLTNEKAQRILRFVRTSKAVSGADVKKKT
jgi:hypothetical protein